MAVVLGGVPALGLERGHVWIAMVCIALQVILITLAISFLIRSRRGGEASPCDDTSPAR